MWRHLTPLRQLPGSKSWPNFSMLWYWHKSLHTFPLIPRLCGGMLIFAMHKCFQLTGIISETVDPQCRRHDKWAGARANAGKSEPVYSGMWMCVRTCLGSLSRVYQAFTKFPQQWDWHLKTCCAVVKLCNKLGIFISFPADCKVSLQRSLT